MRTIATIDLCLPTAIADTGYSVKGHTSARLISYLKLNIPCASQDPQVREESVSETGPAQHTKTHLDIAAQARKESDPSYDGLRRCLLFGPSL